MGGGAGKRWVRERGEGKRGSRDRRKGGRGSRYNVAFWNVAGLRDKDGDFWRGLE